MRTNRIATFFAHYPGGQFRLHSYRIISFLILLTFIIPLQPPTNITAAVAPQVTLPPIRTPIPTAIATLAQPTPSATVPTTEELPTATLPAAEQLPTARPTVTNTLPTIEPYPAPPEATPTSLPAPTLLPSPTPTSSLSEALPTVTSTKPVSITLSTLPTLLPGEDLYLEWQLGGWSPALRGAQLILNTPSGFTPLEGTPGSFDPATGRLSLTLQDGAGKVAWSTPPSAEGTFSLSASLMLNGRELAKRALVIQEEGVSQVSLVGGTATGFGGKVTVDFPPGASAEALTVRVRRILDRDMPAYTLSGAPFEVIARSQDTRQEINTFSQPITITLAYDEASLDGEESALSLFYFDEKAQSWTPLPSWVDAEQNLLHATSDHLTQLDYDSQNWQAARLPSLDGAQVTQYTGAAGYSYPLWTPPGPGGLQPSLTLSYNSQVIDSANADTQASWVGMGWSLETGSIERDMHETNDTLTDDTYRISLGGVNGMLLKDSSGLYHTADESFMRIQYDSTNDVWTAWDKQGTQYTFGGTADSRAQYPRCTGSTPKVELLTYRWSLREVKNVFQQALTYTYSSEENKSTKLSCDSGSYTTDLATYPLTIDYPHGHYQVSFVLDTTSRRDYHSGWGDLNSLVFYQKSRLAAVVIKQDSMEVKKYNLSYDAVVFPNILWDNTGHTFTLSKIEEVGLSGDNTLPDTLFDYDNLHLIEATNGYGGSVLFDYESTPWTDVANSVKRKHATIFSWCDGTSETNGQPIPGWSGGGTCFNSGIMGIIGDVTHQAPAAFTQPGAEYLLEIRIRPNTQEGQSKSAQIGYRYGSSRIIVHTIDFDSGGWYSASARFYLPEDANKLTMLVTSSYSCSVDYYHLTIMPTRYPVASKTISDTVTSTNNTFTYVYDEPATNDIQHSLAVSTTTTTRYVPAYSEFRGHAMTRESGPDGQTTWNWFHQDDALQGKAHATLVGAPSYIQSFSSTSWNDYSSEWNYNSGVTPLFERLTGDTAAKVTNSSADWTRGLYRKNKTLTAGESALVQFRMEGASVQTILALASGTIGSDYYRWGVKVNAGNLFIHRCSVSDTNCTDDQQPRLSGLRLNTWYVLLLSLDVQGGNDRLSMRVWERDNPVKSAQYAETRTGLAVGGWRFLQKTYNGVVWLDEYSELQVYSLSETLYDRDSDIDVQPYQPPSSELKVYWTRPVTETLYSYEGDGDWVGTMKRYEYNTSEQRQGSTTAQYGNLTRVLESQWDAAQQAWRDYRLKRTIYYWNTTGVYLVGLPGIQKEYACPANSFNQACSPAGTPSDADILAERWFLYDNHTMFSDTPTAGKLTGSRTLLYCTGVCSITDNRKFSDESHTYDTWGNRTALTSYTGDGSWSIFGAGSPRQTAWTYDTTYNTYRLSETLGGTLTTTWTYTYTLGVLASETDPNNVPTYATYDNFGRLKKIIRPGDTVDQPTFKVDYFETTPFYTQATQKVGSSVNYVQRKYYNGLGQLLQSRIVGATLSTGTRDVLVDYWYDANGRLIQQSVPYDVATGGGFTARDGSKPATLTTYDVLGRPLIVTAPDGTTQTMVYSDTVQSGLGYLETRLTDADGHTTRTLSDLWGRAAQVLPPAGPSVSYAYDIFDRMTNAYRGSDTTTITYDKAGRKVSMSDPDMGLWYYSYDALGNLTQQTDARCSDLECVKILLGYDAFNRLTGKTYIIPPGGLNVQPTSTVNYYYDEGGAAANARGRRTRMTDGSGSTTWTYDNRGRVTQESKVVTSSGTFVTQWGYNNADLVDWMKYPLNNSSGVGEWVKFGYNSQMLLNTVCTWNGTSCIYSYVPGIQYDAAGRVDLRKLGGSDASPTLQTDYLYNPWNVQGGRMQYLRAGTPGSPTSLQSFEYNYDPMGNINWIKDYNAGGTQKQDFTYDSLNRLTSAVASGGSGGTYPLESYTYDPANGNLLTKAGVIYGYNDTAHKHAVTHLAGVQKYSYDANGNMKTRIVGVTTYTLGYDAENRLTAVSGTGLSASFTYDGDGNRVKGVVNSVTITYVGNYFEWTGSTSTMRKYYYASGGRVALRTGTGTGTTGLQWLLGDHLGSTSRVANYDGTPLQDGEVRYKAWGEKRYPTGSSAIPTTYRYTGQRQEALLGGLDGLYFYNSRWYDPALGRFLSADTLIPQPSDPQSWDRYAYTLNNPIRYVDPSGNFSKEQIKKFFGLSKKDSWEKVLKLFEKGRKYEGRKGWLSVLIKAELGDRVKIKWADSSVPERHEDINSDLIFELDPQDNLILVGDGFYFDQEVAGLYGEEYELTHYKTDNGKKVGAAVLIIATDLGVGVPCVALMLTGNPPLFKAGEYLEYTVVLPLNILGIKMWMDADRDTKRFEVLRVPAIPK